MEKELRHVGIGLLLGVMAIVFGVFWAVYMTVKADAIHSRLSLAASAGLEEKFVISQGHEGHSMPDAGAHASHAGHGDAAVAPDGADDHAAHSHSGHMQHDGSAQPEGVKGQGHGWDGDMAAAHERLAKGHIHAMGLGVLTVCLSLMLAWIRAPHRIKTLAAASIGTGSLFYPLAWIIMGYRTTALGAAAAQASVLPMVGLSVLLMALGLLMSFSALVLWLFKRN